jgi:hypothetical protein
MPENRAEKKRRKDKSKGKHGGISNDFIRNWELGDYISVLGMVLSYVFLSFGLY